MITDSHSVKNAHKKARVDAVKQAALLHKLVPVLSEDENDIVRRARNIKMGGFRKVDQASYRQATAFEALLGYLYIKDQTRLKFLLSQLEPEEELKSSEP